MGVSTIGEEGRADAGGGLKLVLQSENGTWWPARALVGPSPSSRNSSSNDGGRAAKSSPVQLLGKPHSSTSLDLFNLEKSKRVKAFRCEVFDDCNARAESSQGYPSIKSEKGTYRENAILHALQLQKQEVTRGCKRPGEEFQGVVCRAKRSQRVYLPTKSSNCLSTNLDPQSSMMLPCIVATDSSVKSGSAGGNTSSRSRGCKSFAGYFRENDKSVTQSCGRTEMRNPVGYDEQGGSVNLSEQSSLSNFLQKEPIAGVVEVQKWKVKGKQKVQITRKQTRVVKIRKHDREDMLTISSSPRNDRNDESSSKDDLVWEGTHSQSPPQGPGSQYLDSSDNGHPVTSNQIMIDVEVTVLASYRREHVPLVSLMSRLNGRAIIGHPIEIEASDISSLEIDFQGHKLFDDEGSQKAQPAWRTLRRTPVSYLPLPHKPLKACENSGNSHLRRKGIRSPPVLDLLRKPLKRRYLLNQDIVRRGDLKPKNGSPRVTCVPVAGIYTRLHEAVGI